jgi:hypothetical protein
MVKVLQVFMLMMLLMLIIIFYISPAQILLTFSNYITFADTIVLYFGNYTVTLLFSQSQAVKYNTDLHAKSIVTLTVYNGGNIVLKTSTAVTPNTGVNQQIVLYLDYHEDGTNTIQLYTTGDTFGPYINKILVHNVAFSSSSGSYVTGTGNDNTSSGTSPIIQNNFVLFCNFHSIFRNITYHFSGTITPPIVTGTCIIFNLLVPVYPAGFQEFAVYRQLICSYV